MHTIGMHSDHETRRSRPSGQPASKVELTIFVAGLILSVVAGVVGYRIVGLYGDGPFSIGFRRVTDPATGKSLLVHETRTEDGVLRRVIDERTLKEVHLDLDADGREERIHVKGADIERVERDRDGDGRVDVEEYYGPDRRLVKAGFSLAGDGVIDAWAYRNSDGQIEKIEVSTRRDGKVNRWEHYSEGQLARVEEDTDDDGRADRWSIYDAGILMKTVIDADRNGQPDAPLAP
ncbi:MAG TPA: hypothetical protein VNI78_03010 [Vicinamibacterales bacterium]|nr:hypothetical protein [Vicinamibacterales bacterium]